MDTSPKEETLAPGVEPSDAPAPAAETASTAGASEEREAAEETDDKGGAEAAPAQEQAEAAEQPDPLEVAKQETERFRNQMLRVAADFDNFRKRSRREVEDAGRRSRDELLRELLPVFDNLERAVAHAEQVQEARAVADGVKMVLRLFHDTLGKLGVARVKTIGEPFDPNVHEAIQQLESTEHAPGIVMAEVLPGYAWDDRLVRAAMVVVAKAPAAPAPAEPAPDPGSSSEQ